MHNIIVLTRRLFYLLLMLVVVSGCNLVDKKKLVEPAEINNVSTPATDSTKTNEKPPQFVLLSFDGSDSIPMWEATRKFASDLKTKNIHLNFTYFVSGVYFLENKDKLKYQPPGFPAGTSKIGFGKDSTDVANRVVEVKQAMSEGHEIASHLNGHFDGSKWNEADWESEIDQFKTFAPWGVVGIRTPLLARNEALYKTLAKEGFKYDSSGTGKSTEWPKKNSYGTWEIPLTTIDLPMSKKYTLSMDYNFYLEQTGGKDVVKKGTPEWQRMYQDIYQAEKNYFYGNYLKTRAPVVIGNHFSLWNDGVYWEAMKSLAMEVCGLPEVRCTTFSELVKYLDSQ